jgi:hypothetical protein
MDKPDPCPIVVTDSQYMEKVLESFRAGGYIYHLWELMAIGLELLDEGTVDARIFIFNDPIPKTDDSAAEYFGTARALLQELFIACPPLQSQLQDKRLRFRLFQDYGMGAILLCTETSEGPIWN